MGKKLTITLFLMYVLNSKETVQNGWLNIRNETQNMWQWDLLHIYIFVLV